MLPFLSQILARGVPVLGRTNSICRINGSSKAGLVDGGVVTKGVRRTTVAEKVEAEAGHLGAGEELDVPKMDEEVTEGQEDEAEEQVEDSGADNNAQDLNVAANYGEMEAMAVLVAVAEEVVAVIAAAAKVRVEAVALSVASSPFPNLLSLLATTPRQAQTSISTPKHIPKPITTQPTILESSFIPGGVERMGYGICGVVVREGSG